MAGSSKSRQGVARAKGVSKAVATEVLMPAVREIFRADPRVRSVGIGRYEAGFGFVVVRNVSLSLPPALSEKPTLLCQGVPVLSIESERDPERLVSLPQTGPGSPAGSVIAEQGQHRPVVCGLQIQNFDNDERTGILAEEQLVVGTIGCLVQLRNGDAGFLSNNHVVAGENQGVRGKDRILQAGGGTFSAHDQVGLLLDFVGLKASPHGANPGSGRVFLNDVDAGLVRMTSCKWEQAYLLERNLPAPRGTAEANVGDKVFKVGRTTGPTWGEVTQIRTVWGPMAYKLGPCWFRRGFVINGKEDEKFSGGGDSGAAIVREDGMVLGLLMGSDGDRAWACHIGDVLRALNCSILQ